MQIGSHTVPWRLQRNVWTIWGGAPTVASRSLDRELFPRLAIPATQPWVPTPHRIVWAQWKIWGGKEGEDKKGRRRKHSTEQSRYALARWNVLSGCDGESLEHLPISATADCHEHIGCPLMSTQLNCIYQLNRNLWRMGAWVELSEGLHGHQPAPS